MRRAIGRGTLQEYRDQVEEWEGEGRRLEATPAPVRGNQGLNLGWGGKAGVRDILQGDLKFGDNKDVVGERLLSKRLTQIRRGGADLTATVGTQQSFNKFFFLWILNYQLLVQAEQIAYSVGHRQRLI